MKYSDFLRIKVGVNRSSRCMRGGFIMRSCLDTPYKSPPPKGSLWERGQGKLACIRRFNHSENAILFGTIFISCPCKSAVSVSSAFYSSVILSGKNIWDNPNKFKWNIFKLWL